MLAQAALDLVEGEQFDFSEESVMVNNEYLFLVSSV
jgi:hypothetical protein